MAEITIKLEWLKSFTLEIERKISGLTSLQDKYHVIADEEDITALIEELEYFKQVVANIEIA